MFKIDYDDDWIKFYKNRPWVVNVIRDRAYLIHSRNRKYFHRVVANATKNIIVDHINNDPTDNRRFNLRLCTKGENNLNRKIPKNNKSGHKGVYFNKNEQKYRAYIQIKGKNIHLGYYKCPKEASEAYNRAAIKYHKEFSRTNRG